jgi:hypothetical protein
MGADMIKAEIRNLNKMPISKYITSCHVLT